MVTAKEFTARLNPVRSLRYGLLCVRCRREAIVRISSVVWCLFSLTAVLIAPCQGAEIKRIAISMIVEVPQLLETKEGVLKGLADSGFIEGKTLNVDYQTANGNMATQQQIARKFAGDRPDAIVSITTPTSQAMATAAKEIPLIFVT